MNVLALVGAGLFLGAYGLSRCALPPLERAARRSGPVDRPGGRKNHRDPTPVAGGVAVLLAVALPSLMGLVFAYLAQSGLCPCPAEILVHIPGVLSRTQQLSTILAGSGILFLMGFLDDVRPWSPWPRLFLQIGCATALLAVDLRITLYIQDPLLQGIVTVLFVVFATNAFNFIDNMNGLFGGLTILAASSLLVLAIWTNQLFMAAILLCLTGGLCAFLPRNFPEARVFVGDAGSMGIGFLMASSAVAFTYGQAEAEIRPFVIPLSVLFVPLLDAAIVVLRRIARGQHPFVGGHDHLSHALVRRGWSPRAAVLLLCGVQFLASIAGGLLVGGSAAVVAWVALGVGSTLLLGWWPRRLPKPGALS